MGNGKILVYDKENTILDHDFNSKSKFTGYKFIINNITNNPITVEFKSDYAFTLRNVAVYDSVLSDNEEDIPTFGTFVRYDMTSITDDYLAFSSPPVIEDKNYQKLFDGYEIETDTLLLPYNARGVYRVSYKRKPQGVKSEPDLPVNNSTKIDLDEELCTLLPLLTASYIWLEDEPERSMYYKNLYNERAAEILSFKRNITPAKAININGW